MLSTQVATIEADRNDLQAKVTNLENIVKEMSNYDYIASIAEKDGIKAVFFCNACDVIVSIAEKDGIKANQSNVKILSANK